MSNTPIYCLFEKKITGTLNPQKFTSKNNKQMIKGKCESCGRGKSKIVQSGGCVMCPEKLPTVTKEVKNPSSNFFNAKGPIRKKGGNLIDPIPIIANATGQVVSGITTYADHAGDRLVHKGEATGKYDAIAAKRARATQRKNLAQAQKMVKKNPGTTLADYLPGGKYWYG